VTDKTTQLLRQVHPTFIQNGVATNTLTFRPKESDHGLLSVYDGSMITADRSHAHYTEILKLRSCGVLAVTVAECDSENLPAESSPLPDFDEHAHIDFNGCDKKQLRDKSKSLLAFAVERNWLFQTEG
jgi:hypothetical protein